MLHTLTGTVVEILERRDGLLKLKVEPLDDPADVRRALLYPDLSGPAEVGDQVLLNVTATALNLGTGGWDFVIANLTRALAEPRSTYGEPTAGHLMKLRYTPHQVAFQAAEEQFPDLPESLAGRPVLIAELHSQIAPVLLGLKGAAEFYGVPYPRVAYLMPDPAAIPLAFSETIPQLKERGLLHAVVTCGQSFGGDFEAVTLGSGMAFAAGPVGCDVMLVAQGPGNAGTGSLLGFGGVYGAEAAHLVAALDGDPILVARVSGGDPRERHRGLSHHTRTLLERLLLAPVTLPLPEETESPSPSSDMGRGEPTPYGLMPSDLYRVEWVPYAPLRDALESSPLPLRSMGRGLNDDSDFFMTAAAAGWVAGVHHSHRIGRETPQ